jgi:hypothetical protein
MKKEKVLLIVIVVLAVVGGALAFKVRGTQCLYCAHPVDGKCTVLVCSIKTTPVGGVLTKCITGGPTTGPCPFEIRVTNGL